MRERRDRKLLGRGPGIIHVLLIDGRRARSQTILGVDFLRLGRILLGPLLGASVADRHTTNCVPLFVSALVKNIRSPHKTGEEWPTARQFDFPQMFVLAPAHGNCCGLALPRAIRPAEAGPFLGGGHAGKYESQTQSGYE